MEEVISFTQETYLASPAEPPLPPSSSSPDRSFAENRVSMLRVSEHLAYSQSAMVKLLLRRTDNVVLLKRKRANLMRGEGEGNEQGLEGWMHGMHASPAPTAFMAYHWVKARSSFTPFHIQPHLFYFKKRLRPSQCINHLSDVSFNVVEEPSRRLLIAVIRRHQLAVM